MNISLVQINFMIDQEVKKLFDLFESHSKDYSCNDLDCNKRNFLNGKIAALTYLKTELNNLKKQNCKCGFMIDARLVCVCDSVC